MLDFMRYRLGIAAQLLGLTTWIGLLILGAYACTLAQNAQPFVISAFMGFVIWAIGRAIRTVLSGPPQSGSLIDDIADLWRGRRS